MSNAVVVPLQLEQQHEIRIRVRNRVTIRVTVKVRARIWFSFPIFSQYTSDLLPLHNFAIVRIHHARSYL